MDSLQQKYESVYKEGKESFFSKYQSGNDISETRGLVWNAVDWKGKKVIDIGCGTGEVVAGIAKCGARQVLGIDYAENAIQIASKKYFNVENVEFKTCSLDDFSDQSLGAVADVVVSLGTIEHMDDPRLAPHKMLDLVGTKGKVILTCPYFINTRGLVWMTLALALDVPMSLTDKHFISPFDIRRWLDGTNYVLTDVKYFDDSRANGEEMLLDMDKRLHNALRDAKLPVEKVPKLISWLRNLVTEEHDTLNKMHGASALYLIESREENIK